jgi:two-component system sensor histidine kinase/response regulator
MSSESNNLLVVDDNPLILSAIKNLLELHNHHVLTAYDGEEASKVLEHEKVDLIISDIMMPKLDGINLFKRLRSSSSHWHIPFIFLTAVDNPNDIKDAKAIGADDYVTKPFDPEQLLSLIQGKLSRSKLLRHTYEEMYSSFRRNVIQTLSHEFKTPLLAVTTGSEFLMSQDLSQLPEHMREMVGIIHRGGKRLRSLVDDFITFQRIEAGMANQVYESQAQSVPFSQLLVEVVESRRSQGHINLDLHIADDAANLQVWSYEPHLVDAINRILINAQKFSKQGDPTELHLIRDHQMLILQVMDRGRGIDHKRSQEAMEFLQQLDRDRYEQQGVGLGLAIAERYAHINGGRIQIRGRDGGGTTVELILPIHHD